MILPTITPVSFLSSFLMFGLLYILYSFILTPLLRMRFYTQQGAVSIFYWKLIGYLDNYKNAVQRGDFYYNYKETLRKHPKAPMIVENFGSKAYLILVDLELVKEVWKRHEIYQKDKYPLRLMMDLAGLTTIFAEEQAWKKGRRIISSAFNYEFLKHIVPMIVEATQEKFNGWIHSNILTNMNLLEQLADITGEITGRFFFGRRFGGRKVEGIPITTVVHQQLNATFGEALTISYVLFGPRLVKANIFPRHREMNRRMKELRGICTEIIQEAQRSDAKENNLLGLLLEMRKSGQEEDRMTDEQIVGEFVGLFGAGTDTTSHLINSAIYFMWKYPHVFERVKREVDQTFGDLGNISIESINKMEYMTAFIKETLRLGGPTTAYFFRTPVKDDNLCGYKIKAGTVVNFHPDVYYSSEEFFPNAKEFNPERWLSEGSYTQTKLKTDPYAFIPFSAGPRNCVGQHLAMIEARLIIGLFIKTFKFSFPEDYQMKFVKRFLYEPLEPLLVTLQPLK